MPMWKQFVNKFPGKSRRAQFVGNGSAKSAAVAKKTSSAVFPSSVVAGIEPLLSFKDVPDQEKQGLLVSKLNHCCTVFDFSEPDRDSEGKDLKRRILVDLVDYISPETFTFSEAAITAICRMFVENLRRTSSPKSQRRLPGQENEEDEPVYDPAWWHLQIVYELLLKFVTFPSLDLKIAKKYVDQSFALRLLDLFDSEDPRERDSLKTILHGLYSKFTCLRSFIRKSVSNILYTFAFETQRHNGITELLEVFGSIIGGFALPLKEEHKVFLCRTLIPLHKPRNIGVYHQELTFCLTQFLNKEPTLSSTLISGLLKYWPVTNSQKEVMFLSELEEVLEAATMVEFQKIMVPLFRRIALCLNSYHYQVAERALFLWNNDHILNLIAHNHRVILPIVYPSLERNDRDHWNRSVLNATENVRNIFTRMDEELVLACQEKFEEEALQQAAMELKRMMIWERLESASHENE